MVTFGEPLEEEELEEPAERLTRGDRGGTLKGRRTTRLERERQTGEGQTGETQTGERQMDEGQMGERQIGQGQTGERHG